MQEMLRCRMRHWDGEAPVGDCVLTRASGRLRAELHLQGLRGQGEWHLLAPSGQIRSVPLGMLQGDCTRSWEGPWLGALPDATWVTLSGSPAAFGLRRPQLPESRPVMNIPQTKPAPSQEETPASALPLPPCPGADGSSQEEAGCTDSAPPPEEAPSPEELPPAPEEAPSPEDAELYPEEEPFPEQTLPCLSEEGSALAPLPWALDAASIDQMLNEQDTVSPFPGMLEGARFVRASLGSVSGADHYVAGRIDLSGSAAYYLVGIPACSGFDRAAAQDFTHYLPSRSGDGYWVKYIRAQ